MVILFRRYRQSRGIKIKSEINDLRVSCDETGSSIEEVKQDSARQEERLSSIMALYDLTREINKSLKPQEVQDTFKELLKRHVDYGTCEFVKEYSPEKYPQAHEVFELELGTEKHALVVSGLDPENREACSILKNQLVLGLRRAYLYEEVQRLAITDALCGIFSRRYVLERMEGELSRSKKFQLSFSLLMVDLDNFKQINDTYGHLAGDAALKECARIIKDNLRQVDLIGRFGGEEFVIMLTETATEKTRMVSERIRKAVESTAFKAYDEKLKITISIGASIFPEDADNLHDLIDRADSALYTAKKSGRNKVCIFGQDQR